MKRHLCFSISLILVCFRVTADRVYELDLVADTILAIGTLGVLIPSMLIEGSAGDQPLYDTINSLDKAVMVAYDKDLDDISTIGAYVALLMPSVSVRLRTWSVLSVYGAMYSEAFFLTMGTKDLLKAAITRHRPFTYLGSVPPGEEDDYYNSFPSGHTAFAFLGATFLATTFSAEYPRSRWKVPIITTGYVLAAGIAWVRVLSGSHFITDIIAGALIGSFYGWAIPVIHMIEKNHRLKVAVTPTASGINVRVSF